MNTMNKLTRGLAFIAVAVLLFSCGNKKTTETTSEPVTISVYAAASLSDVLTEIIDSFQVNNNVKVVTNLASSGTLARQIEQGEVPDLFLSASKKWGDYVDSLGHKIKEYKKPFAKNDLVLIAPADSKLGELTIDSSLNMLEMLGDWRLSVGDPEHVPAGKYAQQALTYYGWYTDLQPKLLPAKDVRSALMVVEMGESPLGIVYRSDALKSEKVKILGAFPKQSHKPITYVAVVCKDNQATIDFYDFINCEAMLPIWSKYGFNK